jgi:hypothetical protein
MALRKTTWAILAWTALWIVGLWALDPAATIGPGGRLPPAWALFDLWAIGFVALGAIRNAVPTGAGGGSNRARTEDRPVRMTMWTILGWTVLWIVLFGIWALDPDPFVAPSYGGPIHLKPADWLLFDFWFIGFAGLSAIWLVARWWTGWRRKSRAHHAIGGS